MMKKSKCPVCDEKLPVGGRSPYCSVFCGFKLRYMYYHEGKKKFTKSDAVIEEICKDYHNRRLNGDKGKISRWQIK